MGCQWNATERLIIDPNIVSFCYARPPQLFFNLNGLTQHNECVGASECCWTCNCNFRWICKWSDHTSPRSRVGRIEPTKKILQNSLISIRWANNKSLVIKWNDQFGKLLSFEISRRRRASSVTSWYVLWCVYDIMFSIAWYQSEMKALPQCHGHQPSARERRKEESQFSTRVS